MNVYRAILKAADHIDSNPDDFKFSEILVPKSCGTPGCALGWIGYYTGLQLSLSEIDVPALLGLSGNWQDAKQLFYNRMSDLSDGWRSDASRCAHGLRLYAAKYHSDQKPQELPADILAIFSPEPEEYA